MSIKAAIDAVVRCVICDQRPGCNCWVRLRCPHCPRTQLTERIETDGDAKEIEIPCPDCVAREEVSSDG